MIQAVGEYILVLTVAALVCSIMLSVFPKEPMHMLIKLLGSIFLITTALSPIAKAEIPDCGALFTAYKDDGTKSINIGIQLAKSERNKLIKEGLQTYILNKATDMGYQVHVDITLDPDGIPESVRLKGDIPSVIKHKLSNLITKDLGISEDDQRWIAENGRN